MTKVGNPKRPTTDVGGILKGAAFGNGGCKATSKPRMEVPLAPACHPEAKPKDLAIA